MSNFTGMPPPERNFGLCETCGHIIPSRYHSRKCKGEIKIKCFYCEKTFSPNLLKRHERIHFPATLSCQFCPLKFKRKDSLHNHIKFCHEDCSKLHICDICGSKEVFKKIFNNIIDSKMAGFKFVQFPEKLS